MSKLLIFHYGLSDLPNTEGFRFRGWLPDGELIPCVVAKNAMGMHFAVTEDDRRPIYDRLKGWTAYMQPQASLSRDALPIPSPGLAGAGNPLAAGAHA